MLHFGKRLKQIRTAKNLTIKDLSYLTGFNRNTISKWENGEAEPKLHQIQMLAILLGVSADFLLDLKEIPPKHQYGKKFINRHKHLVTK